MALREDHRRGQSDEINDVLGTPLHWHAYFLKDLSREVYGPFIKKHVIVSRFYQTLKPPVVVDFEPHPRQGKFFLEEKRQYFAARGIVYVPIYLADRLTRAQFAERVKECRAQLAAGARVIAKAPIDDVALEAFLVSSDVQAYVVAETQRRVDVRVAQTKAVHGAALQKLIAKTRTVLLDEIREKARKGTLEPLTVPQPVVSTTR